MMGTETWKAGVCDRAVALLPSAVVIIHRLQHSLAHLSRALDNSGKHGTLLDNARISPLHEVHAYTYTSWLHPWLHLTHVHIHLTPPPHAGRPPPRGTRQRTPASSTARASPLSTCISGRADEAAVPWLYHAYCIGGTILAVLYLWYQNGGTVLVVPYWQYCIGGTVLVVP